MITALDAKAGTFKAELPKNWRELSLESIDRVIHFAMDTGRYTTSWACALGVCREGRLVGSPVTLDIQKIDELENYIKNSGYKVEKSIIRSSTLPPFLDISWEN